MVTPALPMFLLGGLLGASGALMFLLPETLSIQMPNTIQDIDELWGNKKKETNK